ncbi:MAG: GNAT family N-acetyltransferase [bacterium]|nr:GNAT family N-acetyltransferase [bacterium]
MNIRIAAADDAAELVQIYAPYVENTPVTFEYLVPSAEEFKARILHTLEKYPYLVAEENGVISGYAYASAFKSRAAYDWSVETSIYVREGSERLGIGRLLYSALEELLKKQHICNLCACIAWPNPSSIAFHESFGYKTVAHFHASGFKQGVWYDMIWMEKELCPHTASPLPFIPFPELERRSAHPAPDFRGQ